jgi:hypothetical protein
VKRQVSLNNTSFERAGITKDCKDAICEYIWNGFEAGATKVSVNLNGSPLHEAMSITVADNGEGIQYESLNDTFDAFLSSTKNDLSIRIKSQINKGKGRFSYQCFSSSAEWTTVYAHQGVHRTFKIKMDAYNRREYDVSDPTECLSETGTTVDFPIYENSTIDQLSFFEMSHKLQEEFAWFLFLNKKRNFSLVYMGVDLDYSQYINTDLSRNTTEEIDDQTFDISVVVWKSNIANSSKAYFLSEKGEVVAANNTSFNKNTVEFNHAVFISSSFFKPGMFMPFEDKGDQLAIDTFNSQRSIFSGLRKKVKSLVDGALRAFLVLRADQHLSEMEKRGALPKFSDDEYGKLRKRDFEAVTRELFCVEPKLFYKLKPKQEKSFLGFLNLLLSSEEREHILQIVEQVVSLTPDQRRSFAEILQRTKLDNIIEAISIIERRVAVVEQLKRIVFDMTSFANERDHIQQIIEKHFWLFGEQYHLLTADRNMKTSLQELEKITEVAAPNEDISLNQRELLQRIDIFLYSQRVQENKISEMLIIELKAPSIPLSLEVYNQVVRYANIVRKEPRFNATNRIWKFFAVCRTVEDEVASKYTNFSQHGKLGLVEIIGNFEIYALSWDDVFQAFEARHDFMLSNLKLDYSQVSAALSLNDDFPISREKVDELSKRLVTLNE